MKARNLYGNELSEALELEGQNFRGEFLGNAGIEKYLKEKQINRETAELLKEFYDQNKEVVHELSTVDAKTIKDHKEYSDKIMTSIIDQFLLINSATLNKLVYLRDKEWFDINHFSDEFKTFKASLPEDERITHNGYLIYRKKVEVEKPGLPGFPPEKTYEYQYGNPAEDMTVLFGTAEYCKQYKELVSKLIPWDKFLSDYYHVPYPYYPKSLKLEPLTNDWFDKYLQNR